VNQLFKEFEDVIEGTVYGSGDVKYHLGAEGKYTGLNGQSIAVSLAPNPSHLEAVDPVVEGIVRAKLDMLNDPGTIAVLPILLHGDSAFIGQGVVAETLNLSQLAGYKTGGTVHLVVNNQVGFTTNPESARSSVYCTDVAKMVQAPIFHVNGDDPEACYRVGKLAFAFRQEFKKDVVIDMVCYRRMGHNEGDEPRYTQPLMYERIDNHPSTRELYAANLVGRKDITQEEADRAYADFQARMQSALDETRNAGGTGEIMPPNADDIGSPFDPVATGVDRAMLDSIAAATHSWPSGFNPHPKLVKQLETRAQSYATGEVDWALGEAFAFGSMALEGRTVRVSGQDSRRGTFSHRQAVLIDVNTGTEHYPLKGLSPDQGPFSVYDSSLSEYAVLGFEYGYSFANPDAFVVWEAQFGDFVNGAQIMIDQFIVAAETKWKQLVSLTMLLPHGYEGQGPEHSSARLERFLQSCAEENIRVANVTTSVQLFHLLRRQVHSANRKPLVVMSPKSGLRAKQSRSHVDEFTTGAFREVLDDGGIVDPATVRRVVLCSGKVAWDAIAARDAANLMQQVAVVRVEQLYPWPEGQITNILRRYVSCEEMLWLQEEPQNMGAWTFVQPRLGLLVERTGKALWVVARPASGSPAVGSHHAHDHELDHLKSEILANL
jgi:multifunctional 2-oxoglutarate metabolism enzyme